MERNPGPGQYRCLIESGRGCGRDGYTDSSRVCIITVKTVNWAQIVISNCVILHCSYSRKVGR